MGPRSLAMRMEAMARKAVEMNSPRKSQKPPLAESLAISVSSLDMFSAP